MIQVGHEPADEFPGVGLAIQIEPHRLLTTEMGDPEHGGGLGDSRVALERTGQPGMGRDGDGSCSGQESGVEAEVGEAFGGQETGRIGRTSLDGDVEDSHAVFGDLEGRAAARGLCCVAEHAKHKHLASEAFGVFDDRRGGGVRHEHGVGAGGEGGGKETSEF